MRGAKGARVIRRSLGLVALYLLGVALVGGWALGHVFGGTVSRENAAGVIVFPLGWIFGFWPTAFSVLLALRVRRLPEMLERYGERRAAGPGEVGAEEELVETLTQLAAEENGIPKRLVRPFVQRVLRSAPGSVAQRPAPIEPR